MNTPFLRDAGRGRRRERDIANWQDAWRNNLQSVLADYDPTLWLLLLALLLLPIDVGVRRLIVTRRELATLAGIAAPGATGASHVRACDPADERAPGTTGAT